MEAAGVTIACVRREEIEKPLNYSLHYTLYSSQSTSFSHIMHYLPSLALTAISLAREKHWGWFSKLSVPKHNKLYLNVITRHQRPWPSAYTVGRVLEAEQAREKVDWLSGRWLVRDRSCRQLDSTFWRGQFSSCDLDQY